MAETREARVTVEALAHRYVQAYIDNDWNALYDLRTEDYVQEYPQSGERIQGRDNNRKVDQNYPGGQPAMTTRRIVDKGDLWIIELELRYPGSDALWFACDIAELRDGKVAKESVYWSESFEAPDWRKEWVETI